MHNVQNISKFQEYKIKCRAEYIEKNYCLMKICGKNFWQPERTEHVSYIEYRFGVKSMAQDLLVQDSMTNDIYLMILCVEQP